MSNFRRRLMMNSGDSFAVSSSKAVAGDIACYNKALNKIVIIPFNTFISDDFIVDNYEPIGVVVIPGAHNVYNNGKCGIISCKVMYSYDPNNGTTDIGALNQYGNTTDIGLNEYSIVNTNNNSEDGECSGTNYQTNLPSTAYNNYICNHDKIAQYAVYSSYLSPSPYLNENRNPGYYQTTSPSNNGNALSDFNGLQNTKLILEKEKGQENWKTDVSIDSTENKTYNHFPAACCCWRFSPIGTKQGDWYFPAIGELGYVIARLKEINTAFSNIRVKYGDFSAMNLHLSSSNYLLSSTIYNIGNNCRNINLYNGSVSYTYAENYRIVVAFLQI